MWNNNILSHKSRYTAFPFRAIARYLSSGRRVALKTKLIRIFMLSAVLMKPFVPRLVVYQTFMKI